MVYNLDTVAARVDVEQSFGWDKETLMRFAWGHPRNHNSRPTGRKR